MVVEKLIKNIKNGEVVIIPTDTLHAISCDACNNAAVEKLIVIKGRKDNHPLPLLVKDIEQAIQYGELNSKAIELAGKYWPGALTLVVPIKANTSLSPSVYGDFKSIALRVPQGEIVTELLNNLEKPLIGTSANISGEADLLTEEELIKVFADKVEQIVFVPKLLSIPSTIVDCISDDPKILRQGSIKI